MTARYARLARLVRRVEGAARWAEYWRGAARLARQHGHAGQGRGYDWMAEQAEKRAANLRRIAVNETGTGV